MSNISSAQQSVFDYMLSSNAAWSAYKAHQNPAFFPTLASGESPAILWLGCSDSQMPETTLLGLQAGDVMSHRNFGNIIPPTDINALAAIEYAVEVLKVRHVVLCGHTGCDAVGLALKKTRMGSALDTWIVPLRVLARSKSAELEGIREEGGKSRRLAELNVEMGVNVLMANWAVERAVRERGLRIHGILFDVASGRIVDMGFGTAETSAPGGSVAEVDWGLVGRISSTSTVVDWLGPSVRRYEVKTYDIATVVDWLASTLAYEVKKDDKYEAKQI